jgi:hypothetical protein
VLFDAIRAVDLQHGDGERAIAAVERAGGEIVRTTSSEAPSGS